MVRRRRKSDRIGKSKKDKEGKIAQTVQSSSLLELGEGMGSRQVDSFELLDYAIAKLNLSCLKCGSNNLQLDFEHMSGSSSASLGSNELDDLSPGQSDALRFSGTCNSCGERQSPRSFELSELQKLFDEDDFIGGVT